VLGRDATPNGNSGQETHSIVAKDASVRFAEALKRRANHEHIRIQGSTTTR